MTDEMKEQMTGAVKKIDDLGKKYQTEMTDMQNRMEAMKKSIEDLKALKCAGPAPAPGISEEMKSMIDYMAMRLYSPLDVKKASPADTAAVLNPANGGVLAVEDYVRQVQTKMVDGNPLLGEVSSYVTTANSLGVPVELGKPQAYFLGELETAKETTPNLGMVNIAVKSLRARIPMSRVLLSASNLVSAEEYAVSATADAMGYAEEKAILTGDGVNQPSGLLNAKLTKTKTGAASGVTREALLDGLMMLPERADPNAKWLMNKSTFAKVVSALGKNTLDVTYGYQEDVPRLLFGKPVVLCASMPDLTQTKSPAIIVGDLRKGYATVTNGSMEFLRDDISAWGDGLVMMNFWAQFGGAVVNPDAFVSFIPGA